MSDLASTDSDADVRPDDPPASTRRLPLLQREDLTEQQRELYDEIAASPRKGVIGPDGGLRGPFNAMLLSPTVGGALQRLGSAIRFHGLVTDRTRELAILLVAAHLGCEYEWQAHVGPARSAGLTSAEIDALRSNPLGYPWTHPDDVLVDVITNVITTRSLSEADYARANDILGRPALFELTTIVGYYFLLAIQLNCFGP